MVTYPKVTIVTEGAHVKVRETTEEGFPNRTVAEAGVYPKVEVVQEGNFPKVRLRGEFLTEAQTLFDAMAVEPPYADRVAINDLITQLKADDVWDDLDVLYVPAVHDSEAALYNWKDPTLYKMTIIGSPTFTAYEGFTGDGAAAALDTGWVSATHGVGFTQDAAHVSAWTRTSRSVGATYALFGARRVAATANAELLPIFSPSADATFARLSDNASGIAYVGNIQGFWVIDRPDAAGTGVYLNDTTLTAPTVDTSVGLPDRSMYLLATNGGSVTRPSGDQISIFTAGAALGATKRTALHSAFTTYLTAIGAL